MNVTVLCFGPLRNVVGSDTLTVSLETGRTIADLRRCLSRSCPDINRWLNSARIAVNHAIVGDEVELQETDEIALIPPVSGGSVNGNKNSKESKDVWVALVRDPIPTDRVHEFTHSRRDQAEAGAIATFEGTTRAESDVLHGRLTSLEYEAYQEMALAELDRLARQAKKRWGLIAVAVIHRLGDVPIGQASVMIATAAGHRAEAFEACRWLIDTLKKDVPVWKRDRFENGFARWTNPNAENPMT